MSHHLGLDMPMYPSLHGGQSFCLNKIRVPTSTWIFALCFSLLFHGALLISNGGHLGTKHQKKTDDPVVVWLNITQAEQQPTQKKQPITQQPTVTKKSISPKLKPKKTPKPQPIKKEKLKTAKSQQSQQSQSQPTTHTTQQKVAQTLNPATQQGLLESIKQQYLALVLQHIEQHKYYPKAARRRGIEGTIAVSLHILQNGKFNHITVGDSPSILYKAIQKTLTRSEPLPQPPTELTFPLQLQFHIQFSLQK